MITNKIFGWTDFITPFPPHLQEKPFIYVITESSSIFFILVLGGSSCIKVFTRAFCIKWKGIITFIITFIHGMMSLRIWHVASITFLHGKQMMRWVWSPKKKQRGLFATRLGTYYQPQIVLYLYSQKQFLATKLKKMMSTLMP